jgi:DNA topoisomerase-1
VQSVAVRLIVEREEERRAFRTGVYWDLEASSRARARVRRHAVAHRRSAHRSGKDFDPQTASCRTERALLDEAATDPPGCPLFAAMFRGPSSSVEAEARR